MRVKYGFMKNSITTQHALCDEQQFLSHKSHTYRQTYWASTWNSPSRLVGLPRASLIPPAIFIGGSDHKQRDGSWGELPILDKLCPPLTLLVQARLSQVRSVP